MDEDELSKELEDMENEMNDELVLEAPVVPVSVTRGIITIPPPPPPNRRCGRCGIRRCGRCE